MEGQFKCFLLPSLREMTTRKVAVLLWSGSDILASISKFPETAKSEKEWKVTIEDKIKAKAKTLDLPATLGEDVIDMVGPISLDVKRWQRIHRSFLKASGKKTGLPDLKNLRWTPGGAIDYRKTGEELISCDGLDAVLRYKIASYYCLEDCVRRHWDELPENEKMNFENIDKVWVRLSLQCDLPFWWPHILKGKLSKFNFFLNLDRNPITFNQFSFEYSAKRGNKSAAEHFFQKMTNEEREASLVETVLAVLRRDPLLLPRDPFPGERNSDTVRYLLSVMTPRQRMDVIEAEPFEVFSCFLEWPWQGIISENAGLLWTLLPASADKLEREIKKRSGDAHFSKWIDEFIQLGPTDFRKRFATKKVVYGIGHLFTFFYSADSESIKKMFRNASVSRRFELVFNGDAFMLFFEGVLSERLDMLRLCLREATLSKENRKRLKEDFAKFLDRKIGGPCVSRKFEGFFALLDETDESFEGSEA